MVDDIESQIDQCRELLDKAADAYWQSKFTEAEQIYIQCLSRLDQLFPGESPETAACLLGLGDTYFFQSRYLLALNQYTRLLAHREKRGMQGDPTPMVTAYLKVAKTFEKLNENEQAAGHYKRGLEIAQSNLFVGHPLLTNLLEAYASFLKRVNPESGLHIDLEKKAALSREKYVDPGEFSEKFNPGGGPGAKKKTGQMDKLRDKDKQKAKPKEDKKKKEKEAQQLDSPLSGQTAKHMGELSRSNTILTLLMVTALIVVAGLAGVAVYLGVIQGEAPANAIVQPGYAVASLDGDRKIVLDKGGAADFSQGKGTAKGTYQTLSNPVTGVIFAVTRLNYKGPFYTKTDDGLNQSGIPAWYAQNAKENEIFKEMLLISEKLDSFYEKNEKLPESLEQFLEFEPGLEHRNAFTNLRQLPYLVSGKWPENGDLTKLCESISLMEKFDTRKLDPTIYYTSFTKTLPPGGVLCLVAPQAGEKKAGYLVIGADRNGRIFRDCTGKGALFVSAEPPDKGKYHCPLSESTEPPTETAIVISSRPLSKFLTLAVLSAVDAVLFIPLLLGWIFVRSYTDRIMTGYGTLKDKTKKIKKARFIYFPLVIVYLIFTALVVAEAVLGNIVFWQS